MSETEKVRENRLRRMAARQGYRLVKFRTRDPRAIDFGRWLVVNPDTNTIEAGDPGHMDVDAVERWLTGEDAR